MPQSLSKIYLHITFSTKNRYPFITPNIEGELFKYLHGILRNLECPGIVINGMPDHLHILCLLSRTMMVSGLLEEIKTSSSKWIKTKDRSFEKFYWQNGYGAFSVSQSELARVKTYIERQKEHHCQLSFQEEYIALLRKYQVEYDERYVWD